MPEVLSIEVDDEFDPRPPSQPFGIRDPNGNLNIGLIAGVIVAVVLVIALIIVVANPFGSITKAAKPPSWEPTDPLKSLEAIPLYANDDKIVEDLQNALDDWAKYFTTGDLRDIEDSFDVAGKQYALILKEQPAVKSELEPGEPAKVELGVVGNAGKEGNIYTLRADITWTKPGGEPSNFKWDVKMKRDQDSNNYLVNTIKSTDESALSALQFCDAVKLVAKLDNDESVNEQLAKLGAVEQKKSVASLIDVRLKLWEYVEPAFLKSSAPDSVSQIIDQYKKSKKILEEAANLQEFSANVKAINEDESIIEAHTAVEESAQNECDVDITAR